MARFVECDGGLVNLDHVARVREHRRPGIMGHAFEAADGTVIARQSYPSGHAEELTAPVVPNATGVTAIVVTTYAEDDCAGDRPSAVSTQNMPIVGWRLMYGGAIPVLIEAPAANQTVLVVLPEGQLLCPEDATFNSLDEAKSALLACAQGNWDRAAKKPQRAEVAA